MAGKVKETKKVNAPRKMKCMGECGRIMTPNSSNFFKSNKESDAEPYYGFFPICKNCLKKMLVNEYGLLNREAFVRTLKQMDTVYVPRLLADLMDKYPTDQIKIFGEYKSIVGNVPEYKNKTFEDSFFYEQQNVEFEKKDSGITEEMIKFWGTDIKDPSLYLNYQDEFDRLVYEDGGEINSIKEGYFKSLAILKHNAQQQLLKGDSKYTNTLKAISDICEKCGINPKQVQDKEEANRGTFGKFIEMIENEEPIFDVEKDLGAFDIIKRIIQVFFFGHLAEVLNLKNPLKIKYDETIDEYSVKVDNYDDLMNIEETEQETAFRKIKNIQLKLGSKLKMKRLKEQERLDESKEVLSNE